jgi:hypothetical protein
MQSYVLNEEYIIKLNGFIELFKSLRDKEIYFQNMAIEEGKYSLNVLLSTLAILISLCAILITVDFKSEAEILIIATLFVIALICFIMVRRSNNVIKNNIEDIHPYFFIIDELESLIAVSYEVDLLPLNDLINNYYHPTTIMSFDKISKKEWLRLVSSGLPQ